MDDLSSSQLSSLLNQIAHQDDKALEQLYRHYNRALFSFVRHLIQVDEIAEEIVHDTFLVVQKSPHGFNGKSKFFTWLCGIAKNKFLDHQRKMLRQEKLPVDEWDDELAENLSDPKWDVLGQIEDFELSEVMQSCIDQLPAAQREAIYWVYYLDLRLEDVAAFDNTPVNTIKTRLLQARLKVRNCLESVYCHVDTR